MQEILSGKIYYRNPPQQGYQYDKRTLYLEKTRHIFIATPQNAVPTRYSERVSTKARYITLNYVSEVVRFLGREK
jgi:hypothetical protein